VHTDDHAQEDDDTRADEVRALLRSWPTDAAADDPAAGTALDVPEAAAAEVSEAAARLLGLSGGAVPPAGLVAFSGLSAAQFDQLCLIARVLVVDEHPSSADWTEDERAAVARWTAVLIAHDAEDGVQALLRELRRGGPLRGH
jgi:hypothetical protein